MPTHIKIAVSLLTLIVGIAFFYFESQHGQSKIAWAGAGLSIFMVVAMWIFPEAGGQRKGDPAPDRKRD